MFELTHKLPVASARRAEDLPHFTSSDPASASTDELASQVECLTRLHELAMRLGGVSEQQPAMQAILDAAVESQGAQMGLIWLHEPQTGGLIARASRGFSAESLLAFDRIRPGSRGGSAGKAFARRSRWVIEDVEGDADFAPFLEGSRAAGFRAIHSTPIVTRSGELLGVLSVHFREPHVPGRGDMQVGDMCARHVADVVETHRSQEAVRHGERVYQAIGEALDYGVWSADASGAYTFMSDCFLQRVGCKLGDCLGDGWQALVHEEERAAVRDAWRECVQLGRKWDHEFRVTAADGSPCAILSRAVPVRDSRGVIVSWAGINLDIGRLKRVERELRDTDRRKNEFLATLAHELRNPLAPLRNGLEVMKLAGVSSAASERAREMMERQLGQLVRLVDDLLDVSRVSRGKIDLRRGPVELASVLRNAIETSQPLMIERRHQFTARLPAEKVMVDADVTRLSQVFWNLLNNAAKYTPDGGRIELEAQVLDASVSIVVRDTGVGIPREMLSRVFDIFTQVDRPLEKSQGGLGIGLSIAKRLVEMHGGVIEVTSAGAGKGSEFVVRLPASIEQKSGANVASAPRTRRRVLIAEDNGDSADSLAMMLEVFGNEVRVARDGAQAVEMAESFRPDAILLDIGMPGLNGYAACERIRLQAQGAGALIVALTGWANDDDRERARVAGFDRHLAKPVDPTTLRQMLAELPITTP